MNTLLRPAWPFKGAVLASTLVTKSLLLGLLMLASFQSQAAPEKINWNTNTMNWLPHDAGLQAMQRENKPALVILYADWCPTCKSYANLFGEKAVVEQLDDFVLIAIDIEQEPVLSEAYDFDGQYVPRTVVIGGDQKVMHELYPKTGNHRYYLPSNDKNALLSLLQRSLK